MTYVQILQELQQEFPNVRIVHKGDSRLMKVISAVLFVITFGKQELFMSNFITTIWNTIYVPDHWSSLPEYARVMVLKHERVHLRQAKKYTKVFFSFLYLFVPVPFIFSYFRMKFEKEAYEETIRGMFEQHGKLYLLQPEVKESMVQYFIGPAYLWMWPFRSSISRWYDETVQKLSANH